jgi:hypothetical protein
MCTPGILGPGRETTAIKNLALDGILHINSKYQTNPQQWLPLLNQYYWPKPTTKKWTQPVGGSQKSWTVYGALIM